MVQFRLSFRIFIKGGGGGAIATIAKLRGGMGVAYLHTQSYHFK